MRQAGNAAWVAFALAGGLASVTGLSYARLTVSFDEPGKSFTFIEEIAGAGVAGTVSWFLILGYVFTLSLYAYTFGADGQLPRVLTRRKRGGVPVVFVAVATLLAVAIQYFGHLHEITSFSSFVFLLVFAVVNGAALPSIGSSGAGP